MNKHVDHGTAAHQQVLGQVSLGTGITVQELEIIVELSS